MLVILTEIVIKEKCNPKLSATKAGVKQDCRATPGHALGKEMKNNAFSWNYKQNLGKQNVITWENMTRG